MNFEFSEEQRAFRDSARRYLSENLHYRLGLPERAALAEFRGALAAARLLKL